MAEVDKRPVVVLGLDNTSYGTIRALSGKGIEIHAVALEIHKSPGLLSRLCKKTVHFDFHNNADLIRHWLFDYCKSLGNMPVVIPTSDKMALMLAANADALKKVCTFWNNDLNSLENIVCKEHLYPIAETAGIKVPPYLYITDVETVQEWCEKIPPPYILKPPFAGSARNTLGLKNIRFHSRHDVLNYIRNNDTSSTVLMQVLKGGDGHIFDCYGLCDKNGNIVTMASHVRLRQNPPDFGTTSYGEIPGTPETAGENALFDATEKLLSSMQYHGVFGIEWLQDQATKELYLLDFNARIFSSISHLNDAGLNLPYLAYRELCGESLDDVSYRPELKHLFWIDFVHDLAGNLTLIKRKSFHPGKWFLSLLKCRSFAIFDYRDPGPAFYQAYRLVRKSIIKIARPLRRKR